VPEAKEGASRNCTTPAAVKQKTKMEIAQIAAAATESYEDIYDVYSSTTDKYNTVKKREQVNNKAANKAIATLSNKHKKSQEKLARTERNMKKYKALH
jgi:hypothetical protein